MQNKERRKISSSYRQKTHITNNNNQRKVYGSAIHPRYPTRALLHIMVVFLGRLVWMEHITFTYKQKYTHYVLTISILAEIYCPSCVCFSYSETL